jgi:hypothetical protein
MEDELEVEFDSLLDGFSVKGETGIADFSL